MHKIILFEINELPWEVVDWWTELNPKSPLAEIVVNSRNFETYTTDEGELHPWSTWPTVHREFTHDLYRVRQINPPSYVTTRFASHRKAKLLEYLNITRVSFRAACKRIGDIEGEVPNVFWERI